MPVKIKILIFLLAGLILLNPGVALAGGTINIMGEYIPVIEGARPLKEEPPPSPGIRIVSYEIFRPLNDVINYYRDFLTGNNFLLIGGIEKDGFNASARRGGSMFTIRIFAQANKTVLQFIW